MLIQRYSAQDARVNLADILGAVYYTKNPVLVEKRGRPVAAVISPEDFDWLRREKEKVFAVIDRIQARSADRDPDEVLREVTAEVEEVRQSLYEKRRRAN
jgi:prevent-host-death family protein